ncbi:tryptophan-rich sensory protein [candidate division KSB1 bacterium]|nr:tryptophan-rich sensory protein [candidate division KSB1 bacterium]NIR71261.1 tryptophan-rich sensory protein [candidate division KSB1 bacterium]NIS24790.1 tryptophan-rich sensory protein [candidate division KSB1 bacterium]NIT71697.1 tryptophan-rich sensory protein [candidate division KSB1 bacterium]NIU25426.1 tryptophan-rich sensory protein [candidate division KSB1 bacterium]
MLTFRPWLGLVVFLAICFAAAGIGAVFTSMSVNSWYQTLTKPSWNPPAWIFGPVWMFLYIMMAVSVWLIWRQYGISVVVLPLTLFGIQLFLNAAWSGFFFGLRKPGYALIEIVLLWCAILVTVLSFYKVKPVSAWLMTPYLVWVTFAAMLNFEIWRLNG